VGVLQNGQTVGIFPEGTRNDGAAVYPFKAGVGFIACQSGSPILPVGIRGSHRALGKKAFLPKPHRIEAHVGKLIEVQQIKESIDSSLCAREVTKHLQGIVEELAYPNRVNLNAKGKNAS
jgi:1-acyl-sn-glycerol-3-phosphate acyltransferase